jgi:FtsH-binding integral membrane protein
MALWGFATKRDLTGFGPVLFGALIGFVVASIVFAFTGGETFNLILGFLGVIIFAALTAYDVQKISRWSQEAMDDEGARKMAIFGALQLYLDFVNIFLSLLRIFGSNR